MRKKSNMKIILNIPLLMKKIFWDFTDIMHLKSSVELTAVDGSTGPVSCFLDATLCNNLHKNGHKLIFICQQFIL